MIFLLKSTLFFAITFTFLSFEYNNKSFYNIISSYTGPIGANIQKSVGSNFKKSFNKSKDLITGEPRKAIQDRVKSSSSSLKKNHNKSDHSDISESDKNLLNRLINKTTP